MALPRITVVSIRSGVKREAAVGGYANRSLYWPENLRKDGMNKLGWYANGFLAELGSTNLTHYAMYDASREAKADPIRAQIADLQDQIEKLERDLLAVYESNPEPDKGLG